MIFSTLLYLAAHYAAGYAIGYGAGLIIEGIISFLSIEDKVENRALELDDAFKWKITKAKQNSVNVGIFDYNTNELDTLEFTSEDGVSSDVRNKVGVWQYL